MHFSLALLFQALLAAAAPSEEGFLTANNWWNVFGGLKGSQMDTIFESGETPSSIPKKGLKARSTGILASKQIAGLFNLLYDGDRITEHCDDGTALGNLIVAGTPMAQATFRIERTDPFFRGIVGDFRPAIRSSCNGPVGTSHNPMRLNQIVDVWRSVPEHEGIFVGRSYFISQGGHYTRHWASFIAIEEE